MAARAGSADIIAALLDSGSEVNTPTSTGTPALMMAAAAGGGGLSEYNCHCVSSTAGEARDH